MNQRRRSLPGPSQALMRKEEEEEEESLLPTAPPGK